MALLLVCSGWLAGSLALWLAGGVFQVLHIYFVEASGRFLGGFLGRSYP